MKVSLVRSRVRARGRLAERQRSFRSVCSSAMSSSPARVMVFWYGIMLMFFFFWPCGTDWRGRLVGQPDPAWLAHQPLFTVTCSVACVHRVAGCGFRVGKRDQDGGLC